MILFLAYIYNVYASAVIYSKEYKKETGPVISKYQSIAVTGDSYAGLFVDYEGGKQFSCMGYAIAGRTVLDNRTIMLDAFSSPYRIVVMSIGVNDHIQGTTPASFEASIKEFIAYAIANNKIVFFHSYVDYPVSYSSVYPYTVDVYDEILQRLSSMYDNILYIDMHDYALNQYISDDNIHYGKKFYDVLYDRICDKLTEIEKTENEQNEQTEQTEQNETTTATSETTVPPTTAPPAIVGPMGVFDKENNKSTVIITSPGKSIAKEAVVTNNVVSNSSSVNANNNSEEQSLEFVEDENQENSNIIYAF